MSIDQALQVYFIVALIFLVICAFWPKFFVSSGRHSVWDEKQKELKNMTGPLVCALVMALTCITFALIWPYAVALKASKIFRSK